MIHAKDVVERMPKNMIKDFYDAIKDDIEESSKEGYGGIRYFFCDHSVSTKTVGMAVKDAYKTKNKFLKSSRKKYYNEKSKEIIVMLDILEERGGFKCEISQFFSDVGDSSYGLDIIWKTGYPVKTISM